MRALGLDLGSKRVGVAVSDSAGRVAPPVAVLQRTGDRKADHRAVSALVEEWEAAVVGVGIPYSLDGTLGPMGRSMTAEAGVVAALLPVPVETYDERLTTVTAERSLREQDVRGPDRRKVVDMVAAAVMLQAWLDGRATGGEMPGTEDG